jgi:hypothetical protein
MFTLKILLSLAATGLSLAFVPTSLVPNAHRLHHFHSVLHNEQTKSHLAISTGGSFDFTGIVTTKGKLVVTFEPDEPEPTPPREEVFPGMKLPDNEIPPAIDDDTVQNKIAAFVVGAMFPAIETIYGKPKSEGLGPVQDAFIQTTLKDTAPYNPDYKYFGTGDNTKILIYLLKNDPFFTSALTKTQTGFELRAFDKSDPYAKDEKASLFRKLASNQIGVGHRVNFYLNHRMEITSYEVYDDVTGSKLPVDNDENQEYWASAAIYNVFFHAEAVHANIHVFHYFLTSAFQYVSKDYEQMQQWAKFYANNIQFKYRQVAQKLIRGPPEPNALAEPGSDKDKESKLKNLKSYSAIITGTSAIYNTFFCLLR